MEYAAKIAAWEGEVGVLMDAEAREAIHSAGTDDRVKLELAVVDDLLMVAITPDPQGTYRVCTVDRQPLPYLVRAKCSCFVPEVCKHLSRFMSMPFELEGNRHGLSGEVELLPHLRPWPMLRQNALYDVKKRAVEVFNDRVLSTALANDHWEDPPDSFWRYLPDDYSFKVALASLPPGVQLSYTKPGSLRPSERAWLNRHKEPWPKGVKGDKAAEAFCDRMRSTIEAGDEWVHPPRDYWKRLPSGFTIHTALRAMPAGSVLKMGEGRELKPASAHST